jgi:large subunit ribosomal protein L7e
LLNLIDAYITWGFVNKKTISELVHKRGSYLGDKSETGHVTELDNTLIENHLGKFGIISLEDIVHELNTCSKNFLEVVNFLGFFLLSPTEEVKEKVNIPFFRGGVQGFRGDKINDLLRKMI